MISLTGTASFVFAPVEEEGVPAARGGGAEVAFGAAGFAPPPLTMARIGTGVAAMRRGLAQTEPQRRRPSHHNECAAGPPLSRTHTHNDNADDRRRPTREPNQGRRRRGKGPKAGKRGKGGREAKRRRRRGGRGREGMGGGGGRSRRRGEGEGGGEPEKPRRHARGCARKCAGECVRKCARKRARKRSLDRSPDRPPKAYPNNGPGGGISRFLTCVFGHSFRAQNGAHFRAQNGAHFRAPNGAHFRAQSSGTEFG